MSSKMDALDKVSHDLDTLNLSDQTIADTVSLALFNLGRCIPIGSCASAKTLYRVLIVPRCWFNLIEGPEPDAVRDRRDHLGAAIINQSRGHLTRRLSPPDTESEFGDNALAYNGVQQDASFDGHTHRTMAADHHPPTPGSSPKSEKERNRAGIQGEQTDKSTEIVFFQIGKLQLLPPELMTPVHVQDDEDDEDWYDDQPSFPSRQDIDAILEDTNLSWAQRITQLQGLNDGQWIDYSSWEETDFVVVARIGGGGLCEGVYIVADGNDPQGGYAMPQFNGGHPFAWAEIGLLFQDLDYTKEMQARAGTVATGDIQIVYCDKDADGVFRPIRPSGEADKKGKWGFVCSAFE